MAKTYEPIATTTLGSSAASVTFNSFSGYTDLIIITKARNTGTAFSQIRLRLNGDSGSNYSSTTLYGNGSSAGSYRDSNSTEMLIGNGTKSSDPAADFGGQVITQIMNYSNTTTYKTLISRAGSPSLDVDAKVFLYRSTSAISSLSIYTPTDAFAAGSTFTLYGIKAA